MIIFLITFIAVFFFILVLAWANKGRHEFDRNEVYALIEQVLDHQSVLQQWEIFIVSPISGDTELEAFRRQCRVLDANLGTGMERKILSPEGDKALKSLFEKLKQHQSFDF